MSKNPPTGQGDRRRFLLLLLALLLSIGLAFAGSFVLVVSQNPGAQPAQPVTVYGTPLPSPTP